MPIHHNVKTKIASSGVSIYVKKRLEERRQKKAREYGYSSYNEYKADAEKAIEEGKQKGAMEKRGKKLKELSDRSYSKVVNKKSLLQQVMSATDPNKKTSRKQTPHRQTHHARNAQRSGKKVYKAVKKWANAPPKKRKKSDPFSFFNTNNNMDFKI